MEMSPPDRRTAHWQGGQISYLEAGQGVPLVLLHGIGSGAASWKQQLAGLSEHFRVIAWDAPGYGQSTALTPAEPDAQHYAEALAGFLDALHLDTFQLVGHSLGAVMAARFAAERPERLLGLTLASIATGHARLAPEERERLRSGRLGDLAALGPRGMAEKRGPRLLSGSATEEMRRAVIEVMAAIRPEGYRQAVMMLGRADTRADIARLPPTLPCQVVFGDADVVTPPEANRLAAAERPNTPVRVIPGAGHAVYLEQPKGFNELVLSFARACRRSFAR